MPKYGNSAPGSQKWNFSKKIHFFEKFSRFRFQRALNHPQILSLISQVVQENVILAYYAQICIFGPRLPKMEFFKKLSFFVYILYTKKYSFFITVSVQDGRFLSIYSTCVHCTLYSVQSTTLYIM